MSGFPWWAWAGVAAVLGFAELHAPGAYFIWIALGAAITCAADALWGLPLTTQLVTVIAASALSCVCGYFVYRRLDKPGEATPLNERARLMVGARGTVSAPIINGQGKVRLGDTVWPADGPDLPEGAHVVVRAVKGMRVLVEPGEPRA